MLQQTQVATVRDYFERFVARVSRRRTRWRPPTSSKCCGCGKASATIAGRGNCTRRRRKSSPSTAADFPQTSTSCKTLPGIGRYTAGAIASIAFDQRAPILEANTIRLLSRLIAYRDDPLNAGRPARAVASGRRHPAAKRRRPIQSGADGARLARLHAERTRSATSARSPACVRRTRPACSTKSRGRKPKQTYTELREAAVVVRRNGRVLMRAVRRRRTLGRPVGLSRDSRSKPKGRSSPDEEIVDKVREQTGITCAPGTAAQDDQARRHALPHHARLLRGQVRLGPRPARPLDRKTNCRLAAEHDRPQLDQLAIRKAIEQRTQRRHRSATLLHLRLLFNSVPRADRPPRRYPARASAIRRRESHRRRPLPAARRRRAS